MCLDLCEKPLDMALRHVKTLRGWNCFKSFVGHPTFSVTGICVCVLFVGHGISTVC